MDARPAAPVRHRLILLLTLAVAAGLLPPGVATATSHTAPAASESCPPPYLETDALSPGEVGTGWTVSTGAEPTSFAFEILGIIRNGIGPGRDLIVVETSGAPISAAGGIWYGMSGSPLYVDDGGAQKLIGAVAYGFTWGASPIAGVTPAKDMIDLLDLPSSSSTSSVATPQTVKLDTTTRARIASRSGVPTSQVSNQMHSLAVPLSVTGVRGRTMPYLQDALDRHGVAARPYTGASVTSASTSSTVPVPGGNFAGALSYGDLTWAGVGTTTVVCGDRALAFGHPFLFAGEVALGANDADAMRIVTGDLFGPFKFATLGGSFGAVDQDRLAGIRALIGATPTTAPITSAVTALDTGRSRNGLTDVVMTSWMADLVFFHGLSNIDSVFDQLGSGSAVVSVNATGTRAGGAPWEVEREDRFASTWDIAIDAMWDTLIDLYVIQNNPFEDITFSSVEIDVEVETALRQLSITSVSVSVDGGITYAPADPLRVLPGETIDLRVMLRPHRSTGTQTVDLQLEVPDTTGFGTIRIGGGSGDEEGWECSFDPAACAVGDDDLDGLLTSIASRARNDDLVATLSVYPEFETSDHDGGAIPVAEARERLDRVVSGDRELPVVVGGEGMGTVERLAGRNRAQTAVLVSRATFAADSVDTVVLARGDDHADALAGGPLAASVGGPLLLTGRDRVSTVVLEEIDRLGADEVVLLGGAGAIHPAVAEQLVEVGLDVRRIRGTNRYDTARRIALEVGSDQVYVVSGHHPDPRRGWPDGVAVGGLASRQGRPILLARSDGLPAATATALDELNVTSAIIVGGTATIPASVSQAISEVVPSVTRRAGADRYGTSRLLIEDAIADGASPSRIFIATGRAYPDALAGGAAVAATGGILVLVDGHDLERSWATTEWLTGLSGSRVHATLLGGMAAIGEDVEMDIRWLLEGGHPID